MGKSGRIEQNKRNLLVFGCMDAFNQLVLGVALQEVQFDATLLGLLLQLLVDLFQGGCAIYAGLTAAKQVQIGAMQNQYFSHLVSLTQLNCVNMPKFRAYVSKF